jgi:hypothetical protein
MAREDRQGVRVSFPNRAVARRGFELNRAVRIDPGDRKSHYCGLNEDGVVIEEGLIKSSPAAFKTHLGVLGSCLIAIGVGVH